MISVVIPTFNRPESLMAAIKSVKAQTYRDLEIIVIDDASSVDNGLTVRQFGNDITYFRFEENVGACACRNKGVDLAQGEFVAFLDDDDCWHPEKLERQAALLKTGGDLVYTAKYIIVVQRGVERSRRYSYSEPKGPPSVEIMKKNFIGTTSCILVRRSAFLRAGGFDVGMVALQDYEFYIRFVLNGFETRGTEDALVSYYINYDQHAISKSLGKSIRASIRVLVKFASRPGGSMLFVSLARITSKKIFENFLRIVR